MSGLNDDSTRSNLGNSSKNEQEPIVEIWKEEDMKLALDKIKSKEMAVFKAAGKQIILLYCSLKNFNKQMFL